MAERPLLAQSAHVASHTQCSGVKRTLRLLVLMSAYDPKRTVHAIFTAVPFLKRAA